MHPIVPQPLQMLIERLTSKVVRVQTVNKLFGESRQPCFKLVLENGAILKARLLDEAFEVQRVASLLPYLPPTHFPQLCDWRGRAVLEPWIDGKLLVSQDQADSVHQQAGKILAEVHQAKLPDPLPAMPRSVDSWLRHFLQEVEQLCQADMLSQSEAQLLGQVVLQARPAEIEICLVHRDFCAENLVDQDGCLVSIDNMSITVGSPCEDLARTFYRWHMSAIQKQQFLIGYGSLRDPQHFLRHETFWSCLVLVHAIYYQSDWGSGKTMETLERLKCWLNNETSPSIS